MRDDNINDGGPAFPGVQYAPGMSLRDYFAAKAMHAIMSTPRVMPLDGAAHVSEMAYQMADAMLKARQP